MRRHEFIALVGGAAAVWPRASNSSSRRCRSSIAAYAYCALGGRLVYSETGRGP